MNKTTKWILIGTGVLVVLMIALSKLGVFGKAEGTKVTSEAAKERTIVEVVNASGKLYPEIEVKVSPDISGEITDLFVKEGDTVKAGQVLGNIYADIYSLQRDQAASALEQSRAQVAGSQAQVSNQLAALEGLKASLDQAQRTYDMQKKLYNDKVISQNEFNIAEANYKTALANYNAAKDNIKSIEANLRSAKANEESSRSNLERANKDLSRTAIIAPMDGVVTLLNVKKGERVVGSNMMAGTEILRVADLSSIEVQVDVGENDVPKVKIGDQATVTVDAYSDRKFKGVVTQVASSNNGASSSTTSTSTDATQYKVYVRLLPDSYKDLIQPGRFPFRPGMNATADIETETHQNVVSVPINAVTVRDRIDSTDNNTTAKKDESLINQRSTDISEVVVFVLKADNTVEQRKVSTSIQDINYIEITEGLKAGEIVVTGPYDVVSNSLKQGASVTPVEKNRLYDKK
jgi:HlyD family secretion protein